MQRYRGITGMDVEPSLCVFTNEKSDHRTPCSTMHDSVAHPFVSLDELRNGKAKARESVWYAQEGHDCRSR